MVPSPSTARPPLARKLLPPALIVLSALALMLAIAASTMPALAGVPPTAPRGNAVSVAASATPTAECVQTWDVLYTPSPGTSFNALYAVEDVSPDDIWSVGEADGNRAVIEHWDGTQWSFIPVPEVVSNTLLYDVSANGPYDVWAVGKTSRQDGMHATTLRWDGTQWNVVPNPITPSLGLNLYGVEAISSTLAWAVGNHEEQGHQVPMALRWDGTAWSRVPVPDPGYNAGLKRISATGPNDVWAVGNSTLVMHWDGTAWTQMPTGFAAELYDVVAISPTNVWAVGYRAAGGTNDDALILHWDGTVWTQQIIGRARLTGIDARGSNDVWAVGNKQLDVDTTLVMHWDGVTWTEVPSFDRRPLGKRFYDVALVNDYDLWAVGQTYSTNERNFAARYTRTCPQPLACQTGWNIVRSPDPDPNMNFLYAIDSTASDDVWVAGGTGRGALVRQWDGTHWEVQTGTGALTGTVLYGIKAFSPAEVWAVGGGTPSDQLDLASSRERTLPMDRPAVGRPVIMHYDGASWTYTMTPTISGGHFYDVDGVSPNDLWAVGMDGNNTLIMHWFNGEWSRLPGPPGVLHDVKAVASDFVWAVGSTSESAPGTTIVLKWDGTTWIAIDHPSPNYEYLSFESIDASGPNNAIAVGYSTGSAWPHAIHWDGVRWNRSPVQTAPAILTGVSVLSPTSAWAVGFRVSGGVAGSTVALHWDGTYWTEAPMPTIQVQGVELFDVTAVSSNELWTAGHVRTHIDTVSSLIERYVGTCQTVTPTPIQTATATPSATRTGTRTPTTTATPTGTRTGTPATPTPTPNVRLCNPDTIVINDRGTATPYPSNINVSGVNGTVTGVSISLLDFQHWFYDDVDILLVGPQGQSVILMSDAGGTCSATTTLRFQDGAPPLPDEQCPPGEGPYSPSNYTSGPWPDDFPTPAPQPPYGSELSVFNGTDPNGIWSLYVVDDFGAFDGEIEGGWCLNITTAPPGPSPSPTGPPATATNLPTVTSTPTACTLAFADVPPTNTFYPFVRCLACRGIISGYPCGGAGEPCNPANDPYFRPNNYVTRGQLAKIVSESAGFDEEIPPSQWTFTDVPYGSTFWVWVERLAGREVMSGYPCGGPGEPCDDQGRPYFRPGAGATRGQLTKIVSNAAGFSDAIPPGQYTFADVTPTHTFRLFVERLLLNRPDVMAGYDCGGEGEPCDAENRPYFRPDNPLTRGQTSKIVANTFFPGCDPPRR
ncbi:MAG TPA: S-layer homology domain-containing protein [Chloroflexia bacterium]|nr:S-layer homology domain-containing protein [Chloroflexia bacterium]